MPWHEAAVAFTDFGNLAVACPVGLALVLLCRPAGIAPALAINMACAFTATVLLKLVSRAVGGGLEGTMFAFTTGAPSGHATLAAVVYGSMLGVFACGSRGLLRIIAVAIALALIAGVSVTRVSLGAHSPMDAAAGLAVGGLFAVASAITASRAPGAFPPMGDMLLKLLILAAVMQLSGLRLESTILI